MNALKRLIFELTIAAENYRAQAASLEMPKDKSLFELLAKRCERFRIEIEKAARFALAEFEENTDAARPLRNWREIKRREQIFSTIEGRESRLERLYREALRNDSAEELREILKNQFEIICKWHNFVINEEINFIFEGEVAIPSELREQ